jgi:hypothetical protein
LYGAQDAGKLTDMLVVIAMHVREAFVREDFAPVLNKLTVLLVKSPDQLAATVSDGAQFFDSVSKGFQTIASGLGPGQIDLREARFALGRGA